MTKIQILTKCDECNGEAYLPIGEAEDSQGRKYTRHVLCTNCNGSGQACKWVSLEEFAQLQKQAICSHEHTSTMGSLHFYAGNVVDNLVDVCNDCGAHLE